MCCENFQYYWKYKSESESESERKTIGSKSYTDGYDVWVSTTEQILLVSNK